jgi:hypothetical protein
MAASEAILRQIRANLQDNLKHLYQGEKVFLIDNYERNKYDFDLLAQRLVNDFPVLKRQAFVFSMNAFSEQMVQEKTQELRRTIWKYATLSGLAPTVPVPGLSFVGDLAIITVGSKFFFDQLGLDEPSLERIAGVTNKDPMKLKQIVAKNLDAKKFLTVQGIKELLVSLPAAVASIVAEEGLRFIHFIGSLIVAPISFGTTHYILNHILNKMEEVALLVVRTATQGAFKDAHPHPHPHPQDERYLFICFLIDNKLRLI